MVVVPFENSDIRGASLRFANGKSVKFPSQVSDVMESLNEVRAIVMTARSRETASYEKMRAHLHTARSIQSSVLLGLDCAIHAMHLLTTTEWSAAEEGMRFLSCHHAVTPPRFSHANTATRSELKAMLDSRCDSLFEVVRAGVRSREEGVMHVSHVKKAGFSSFYMSDPSFETGACSIRINLLPHVFHGSENFFVALDLNARLVNADSKSRLSWVPGPRLASWDKVMLFVSDTHVYVPSIFETPRVKDDSINYVDTLLKWQQVALWICLYDALSDRSQFVDGVKIEWVPETAVWMKTEGRNSVVLDPAATICVILRQILMEQVSAYGVESSSVQKLDAPLMSLLSSHYT